MNIELRLPLRNILITQPFGANYLDFYKKMNLLGHNGIDFSAMNGFNCYASHDGVITVAGIQSDGGIEVEIWDKKQNIKTIYYHLKDFSVSVGDDVQAGQMIGHCDNTGMYTTGNHLHFGLKEVDSQGNTINYDNGYKGAIDPAPYFIENYCGIPIKNSEYDRPNVNFRYFRTDGRNYRIELKVAIALGKYLRRLPTNDEIKACVYGGWDREAITNVAMYQNWAYAKKNDILSGKYPFQN